MTCRVAFAANWDVPPLAVANPLIPIAFRYAPTVDAVIGTVIAQDPLPGMLPPFKRIPALPAASGVFALLLSVPPQVLVIAVLATVMALGRVGNVSTNVAPFSVTALELNKVTVRVEMPPALIVLGENDLLMVGRAKIAMAALVAKALLPRGVTSASAGMVLV